MYMRRTKGDAPTVGQNICKKITYVYVFGMKESSPLEELDWSPARSWARLCRKKLIGVKRDLLSKIQKQQKYLKSCSNWQIHIEYVLI